MISVYLHLHPFHNFLCIFSFKKRKVVLIFIVEEKQRHPTVYKVILRSFERFINTAFFLISS